MKKITLSLIAACSFASAFSQVVLQENFSAASFVPTGGANGWIVQNNSIPVGVVSWTTGNQTGGNNGTTAYNGGTNDFYMADFLSVDGNSSGGISAFLMTPEVTIYNGAELQFATRTITFTGTAIYPDRMQVLMSQGGPGANVTVPSGTTNVGPFGTTLLDINPTLSTSYSSVQVGNTVNGYPGNWTVYTIPITGVTGTVTGRFAFRYFVNNGGINGTNSRLIGLDAVKYTLPCGPTVQSYTVCNGVSTPIVSSPGLAATQYSWSTGATTSSITVNPSATTVYTFWPRANGLNCNTQTSTITVGTQLSMSLTASSTTICSGQSVNLSVSTAAPASNLAWTTSGNPTPIATGVAAITVTPSTTTDFVVGGFAGAGCTGTSTLTINVKPIPSLTVGISSPLCVNNPFTITASGAATYTYASTAGAIISVSNPLAVSSVTDSGAYTLIVAGTGANLCSAAGLFNFTVNPTPTVSIGLLPANKTVICVNQTVSLSGQGASTYSWSGASTSTNTSITYTGTAGSLGNKTFNIIGTDANGCTGTAAKTISVSACTGIETFGGSGEASVFPNPFTNELVVKDVTGNVEIYNALGQQVFVTKIIETGTINTQELSKGAYILKVYNAQGEVEKTIKLLKN